MANPNISNIGRRFSSDNQPKNRRKSVKFLSELLEKKLNKKAEVILEGIDIETGEKRKFRIENPTKEILVNTLLQKASRGNIQAIREVFDRIEGKPPISAEVEVMPEIFKITYTEYE